MVLEWPLREQQAQMASGSYRCPTRIYYGSFSIHYVHKQYYKGIAIYLYPFKSYITGLCAFSKSNIELEITVLCFFFLD